jgi:hypothetical protein
MTAVNETIVREYFETQGYLVTQPRKYTVPGRAKSAEEELDVLVYNPRIGEQKLPRTLIWSTADLKQIARAVVCVRGWHTERFYASTFEQTPDILRFVEAESVQLAMDYLGCETVAKVLCLPRLPASGTLRQQTIDILRERGVDGIISFRTMLVELIDRVDVNRNYEKSDLLQTLRILKNYDLVQAQQLELFGTQKRKRPNPRRSCR